MEWSHKTLTGGKLVELQRWNLDGIMAVTEAQIAAKGMPVAVANWYVVKVMAFWALKRSFPDLTLDRVGSELEAPDIATLKPLLFAVNEIQSDPKAKPGKPAPSA